MNPYTYDIVERDLGRYLKEQELEEMAMEREIKITVYDRDYGYGRIVVQHPDGAIYMDDDIAGTVALVEEFVKERMEGKRDGR